MAPGIQTPPSETAVLARLIRPDADDSQPRAAEAWLSVRFETHDRDRTHELPAQSQDDTLTPVEREELENKPRANSFLGLMRAKARRSLEHHA